MIYLDNAATTPLSRPVLEAMWPYLTENYGNPSSHHELGRRAAAGLDAARQTVADVLDCSPREIVFTSGGTESNNLAIKGISSDAAQRRVVTTAAEHHAILAACESLAESGTDVSVVRVDSYGAVDTDALETALTPNTTLCSVMYANNDVGTLSPLEAVSSICRDRRIALHTDAVQAAGLLPLNVKHLGVDAMSISGHKFGGPKGVGCLYVNRRLNLSSQIDGGGQEHNQRSGTQNVAGAVGLATALALAVDAAEINTARLVDLRDQLTASVLELVPEAILTGHPTNRLPNHASFCFRGVAGEAVLQELEMAGVCCSSGSACAAGSDEPSHVLLAMGIKAELAQTAVRFSLGSQTTAADIKQVSAVLPQIVSSLSRYAAR